MKSCPKCNRTFPDEGQKFCTFDGGLLIAPQPQNFDPNATIRATTIDLNAAASERPTSRDLPDPNATIIENYPQTVALPRNTGPTTGPAGSAPNTSDIARPAPPPPPPPPVTPPPPPVVEQPQPRTTGEVVAPPTVATPSAPLPLPSAPLPPQPVAKKKSKVPWIIAGVLLFLLLGGGALAGIFFAFVKPRLDQMAAERNPNRPVENVNVSTPTPSASVEQPTPAPEETYVAPPGTVKFENSNENLDGKLAEHYFDFSFYYPENWKRDPKSGVAGALNFVAVDRGLPPDFTQENFAVGWYTSTGTFVGDLPSFKQKAEQYSNSLAKTIPEYKKVSEGLTKINSMQAYEFRWEGLSKGTERGDLKLWGRVVFLPTGTEGDTTGATLYMLTTSLAGELSSVADVGSQGEMPVILDSFRFGKKK
ncbi:MAG TPA: hypothetical protein VFS90_16525 [Pyrinomonadaceae bacterium]|nr:hypothetical protein [Pyrinomonadaceae bacterium]